MVHASNGPPHTDRIARSGDLVLGYVDRCLDDALDHYNEQSGTLMCRLFDVILIDNKAWRSSHGTSRTSETRCCDDGTGLSGCLAPDYFRLVVLLPAGQHRKVTPGFRYI
jgi:hypothetical protein